MRVKLAPLGPSLISRTRGEAIREKVLADAGAAPLIMLDFDGVSRASYSFIDELVGELSTLHDDGALPASVQVVNAAGTIAFHVDECLARRRGTATAAVAL